MYRAYRIKKPNGSYRLITEPEALLKKALCALKDILTAVPLHDAAHGFVPGRSTSTNAIPHRCQEYVLNIDLKDFFPSIKLHPMMECLEAAFFEDYLSFEHLSWIRGLCFYQGSLPQGSPTSPVLSNIYMIEVDSLFSQRAASEGWVYTRYADDMTFSGGHSLNKRVNAFLSEVKGELANRGLSVNSRKVKITSKSQCQRVTGICVNNTRLTLRGRDKESFFQAVKGVAYADLSDSQRGYLQYVKSIDLNFYNKLCKHMTKKFMKE